MEAWTKIAEIVLIALDLQVEILSILQALLI